jgi:hypothetical protein
MIHLVNIARSALRERAKVKTRSPQWERVRNAFLAKVEAAGGGCAACSEKKRLQVHHEKPYHLHPELELEESNLIVLCMGPNECHLLIGHGSYFSAYDPLVVDHAGMYLAAVRKGKAGAAERRDVVALAKAARQEGP